MRVLNYSLSSLPILALIATCTLTGCGAVTAICVQCIEGKVQQAFDEHLDDSPRTEQCTKLKKTAKESYAECSSGTNAPCKGATCALASAYGLPSTTAVGDLEPVLNSLLDTEEDDDASALESAYQASYATLQANRTLVGGQGTLTDSKHAAGGSAGAATDTPDWDTICAKLREIKRKCANAHPIPVNIPLPPQCEGHGNPA